MPLSKAPALGTPMLPADTYKNDVVLVTGGGTGLGKAIAIEFARAGARVAVLSRSEEHLKTGVEAIEAIGGKAMYATCDIRQPEQIAAAFDKIEAEMGPITVLINNAAGNFPVPAEKMSPNAWRTVTDIVLDGTFFCSSEFGRRRMAAGGGGSILNIGATYAWTGGPGTAHSAAAKAAVDNLTKSLAVEWAPDNIRVNCLAPGLFVHEDHHAAMKTGLKGGTGTAAEFPPAQTVPAQRTGEVHELGYAAVYMCSPYAAYLTGHTLVLDGANWLRRSLRMPPFEVVRDTITRPDDV
ncbi:MAG: SDR family oxidoreductase [Spongiibacteraceae bacterium]